MTPDELADEVQRLRARLHDLVDKFFQPLALRVTVLEQIVDAMKGLSDLVHAQAVQIATMKQIVERLERAAMWLMGIVAVAVMGALLSQIIRSRG